MKRNIWEQAAAVAEAPRSPVAPPSFQSYMKGNQGQGAIDVKLSPGEIEAMIVPALQLLMKQPGQFDRTIHNEADVQQLVDRLLKVTGRQAARKGI